VTDKPELKNRIEFHRSPN